MNSIVYKFNKYYQINGSIFYTFDYFLKAIEERILTNQNKQQIEDNKVFFRIFAAETITI